MAASGIKPTRIALRGAALPDELSIDGDYSGDDVDWDLAPGEGGQDQWKQPVRCATTAAITIATGLNAGDSIDGVTLAAGDRVLVKDQGTASQNGIYIAGTTPARAPDMDADEEVLGAVVHVYAGTANAGTTWRVTNTAATVVDTDAINWAAFGGGGTGAADTSLVTVNPTGAAETVDVSAARTYDLTLDTDCTLTLTGAVASEAHFVTVVLRQDGTGGHDVTWPGSVTWPGGVTPTFDTTASTATTVTLFTLDGGTEWFGFVSGGAVPSALDDLTDVTITGAADGEVLTYDSGTSQWVNAAPAGITAADVAALGFVKAILISDTPSTPLVFADLLQNEAQDDLIYGD